MRLSRIALAGIAAGSLLALFAACNEQDPAPTPQAASAPADPGKGGDGTTAFSVVSSSPTSTYGNTQQPAMDNIAAQNATVKGAVAALKMANELVAELAKLLAELQAETPVKGAGESAEDFEKRHAAHQAKLQAAEKQLKQAQEAVARALAAVGAAQKELQKLQGADLPAAQAKDAKEMEQYFEEEQEKLVAAVKQSVSTYRKIRTDTDDTDDSAAQQDAKAAAKPALSGGAPPSSGLPVDD